VNKFLLFWFFSLFIKLVLSAWLPLSLDESYYWTWGKHLQLSYFDHPPFISWLFYIAQPFDNFFQAVRWPGVILAHCTLLIWYNILKDSFSHQQLFWFFTLAILSPLTGFGSLALTPDLPLVFFWSAGLYFLKLALVHNNYKYFSWLGIVLGLGFCSKYHTVLFLPFSFVYLATQKKLTFNILKKMLPGFVLFFIFSAPVWIWNYQHDFISFKFQLNHGLGESTWSYLWTTDYLLGQILLIFPTLAYLFIRSNKMPQNLKFLHFFAWAGLIFFFITSFKGHVEANWAIFSYLPIYAVIAYNAKDLLHLKIASSIWLLLTIFICLEINNPQITQQYTKIKTNEFSKYNHLISKLRTLPNTQPIYASTYQMASKLSFELKKPFYKLKGLNRKDYFDFLIQSTPTDNDFSVILKPTESIPKWVSKEGYKVIKKIELTKNFTLVSLVKYD
jgi:4-amino-4-deoxy-L-arabinose transferase-like glycosyltransferase